MLISISVICLPMCVTLAAIWLILFAPADCKTRCICVSSLSLKPLKKIRMSSRKGPARFTRPISSLSSSALGGNSIRYVLA